MAFKPLMLLGLNACMQATLRDGRCLDWSSSLMGAIETSLCHGPVFFNVYNIGEAINLRILRKGYNFKVMNTLTPNVKNIHNTLGYTTLIESNMLTSSLASTRMISWGEIDFLENWKIQNAIPPKSYN